MKIRTQLALVLSAVAAASFAACAALAILAVREISYTVFSLHQVRQTEMLGKVATAALANHAEPVLVEAMKSMSLYPGVQYVYLVGKNGRILLHPRREFVGEPVSKWLASGEAADAVEMAAPVAIDGDAMAGMARVGYNRQLFRFLRSASARAVIGPFVGLAAAGIALSVALGDSSTRPASPARSGSCFSA